MTAALRAASAVWSQAGLPVGALARLALTGTDPVMPSSFAVGSAAQASMALGALAASEFGGRQATVRIDMAHAAAECLTHFAIDGEVPDLWDKYSGVYRAADGWVRIHANFAHHRDGALALLGLQAGAATSRDDVTRALQAWSAFDFEQAAADRGLVVAALRTREQWLAHAQAEVVRAEPLVAFESIGDADAGIARQPDRGAPADQPLRGLRVLDLTRILAGPVCGRALAAYGADVLLVNSPNLPNIDAIADTSRGKRSAQLDLLSEDGRAGLRELIRGADVLVQGYRPGGLEALGFGPAEVARLRPGIVYVSLAAWGHGGPWAGRRGFDSLVQSATGLNHDESGAAGLDLASAPPRALPLQILDHATGYLMAFAALAALLRQRREGGSWHLRLSLARSAEWLREFGRIEQGLACVKPALEPWLYTEPSGFGQLTALRHAVSLDGVRCGWRLPAMPPGSAPPRWD